MPDIELFIKRHFPDAYFQGGEYFCKCPAHYDLKESLHVRQGDESDGAGGKKIIMHCKAGCSTVDILEKLNLSWSDINGLTVNVRAKIEENYKNDDNLCGAEVTDIYDYHDARGDYKYSKIRFLLPGGGKAMRYARIDYKTGFIVYNRGRGNEPILYNLPRLLDSIKEGYPVYVVEGEKDVETLQGQHYVATTAGSASDWKTNYARWFRGASVVIMPDNDDAGKKAVNKIERDILKYAYRVKIVYTSKREKGDVTDYLTKDGGTPETLKELIKSTPWQNADYITDKLKINADCLADRIERNEYYLIVRQSDSDKDLIYMYKHGVYKSANKNEFKAGIIRPYIPKGGATASLLDNITKLLLASEKHAVEQEALNQAENYINVKNGLLNIDTWELEKHNPDVLSTRQLNVEYNPTVRKRDNFDYFINDFIKDSEGNPDKERLRIIQEYGGFLFSNIIMMPKIKQALFLISFTGNTGKSTLLRLIESILTNDCISAIDLTELDYNKNSNRFILGKMRNTRLITCGDQSGAVIRDSSRFKRLTGGDSLLFEEKGKQGTYQTFTGGIIIAGNQLILFQDDKGDHIYKRLLVVPLQHRILEKDPGLEGRMLQEKSAIFNWFLEGLKRIRENNYQFSKCEAGENLLNELVIENDPVKRYRAENYIETGNPKDCVSVTFLYDDYCRWVEQIKNIAGEYVRKLSKKEVKARMLADGFSINKHANIIGRDGKEHRNVPCYRGVKIK